MSTNYNLVIKSEKHLQKMILEFVTYCYDVHKKMWDKIWEKEDFLDIAEWVNKKMKISFEKERDIIDECIWIISKDSPRANHLRVIISFIYQSKDVERAINYCSPIIKTILRTSVERTDLKELKEVTKAYLSVIDNFRKIYIDKKIKNKIEEVELIIKKFNEISWGKKKQLKSVKENDDRVFLINSIVKNLENTIERLKNVFVVVTTNEE